MDDPTSLLLATKLKFELMKRSAVESAKKRADAQKEREKAFGRHLTEKIVCGMRCYPELMLECCKLSSWMEVVSVYNDAVTRYEGNCDATLSIKMFRKIMKEI